MTDETVSIPIINPFIIKPDYEIEVNDEELDLIKTHDEEELVVLNIMKAAGRTAKDDGKTSWLHCSSISRKCWGYRF